MKWICRYLAGSAVIASRNRHLLWAVSPAASSKALLTASFTFFMSHFERSHMKLTLTHFISRGSSCGRLICSHVKSFITGSGQSDLNLKATLQQTDFDLFLCSFSMNSSDHHQPPTQATVMPLSGHTNAEILTTS